MKKMSLKLLSGLAVAAAILVSCTSKAYVEKDQSVNFNNYRTYSWIEKDANDRHGSLVEQNIQKAVNQELAKAGWKEVKNMPDVLVGYDVLVERTTREETNPVYSRPYSRMYYNPYTRRWNTLYYPSQFLGYDRNERAVKEGTITITMIDVKTDKTVWQGWTTDLVNSKNLTNKEIRSSVRSIFRKFDVAKN